MASHVSKSLFRQKDVGRRTDTLRPVSLRGSLAVCGVHLPRGGHGRGTDSRWDPLVTYVPTEGKEQQAPGFKYLSVYRVFFCAISVKGVQRIGVVFLLSGSKGHDQQGARYRRPRSMMLALAMAQILDRGSSICDGA